MVLKSFEGETFTAVYDSFKVDDTETYNLRISGYNSAQSNLEDRLSWHNNAAFSTKDQDNDTEDNRNCAAHYLGAWWYKACYRSSLNGYNYNSDNTPENKGIVWLNGEQGFLYSWPYVEMKIERTR